MRGEVERRSDARHWPKTSAAPACSTARPSPKAAPGHRLAAFPRTTKSHVSRGRHGRGFTAREIPIERDVAVKAQGLPSPPTPSDCADLEQEAEPRRTQSPEYSRYPRCWRPGWRASHRPRVTRRRTLRDRVRKGAPCRGVQAIEHARQIALASAAACENDVHQTLLENSSTPRW